MTQSIHPQRWSYHGDSLDLRKDYTCSGGNVDLSLSGEGRENDGVRKTAHLGPVLPTVPL